MTCNLTIYKYVVLKGCVGSLLSLMHNFALREDRLPSQEGPVDASVKCWIAEVYWEFSLGELNDQG